MPKHLILKYDDPLFWSKVDKSGGENSCWPCSLLTRGKKYAKVKRKGVYYRAHRYAYALTHGEVPSDKQVHHACDNPACCNPKHLWLGTQKDNMQDKLMKGRNAKSKLSPTKVKEIKNKLQQGVSLKELAKQYTDVKYQAIYCIKCNKTWKEL